MLFPKEISLRSKFVGVTELGSGMVLADLMERTKGPVLAIFRSRQVARDVIDNLSFFTGKRFEDRIHYIPPMDFDFYRGLLPNPETLCERNIGL